MDPLQNLNTFEKILVDQARHQNTPISGSLELLPLCNMRCNMCYVRMDRDEMERKGGMRSPEQWLELGRQMKEQGTLFLLLTGGEPLLYPGFKEVYLGLRKMGMILTVNTNGTLLTEKWADFFEENRPRRINITLYGVGREAYDQLCHYPDGYDKVISAVQALRKRNVDVLLSTSMTPQNVSQIEEYVDLAHKLDCRCTLDDYMMPAQRERDLPYPLQSRLLPEDAAMARIRFIRCLYGNNRLSSYAKEQLDKIHEIKEKELTIGKVGFTCMAANCSFTVNWQGNMRPCTMLHAPSVPVFEEGFEKAWKQLRKACADITLNEKCCSCSYKKICRTCVAGSFLETGDFSGIADYMCRYSEELCRLYTIEAGNQSILEGGKG